MGPKVNYTLANGQIVSQEEIGEHLAAIDKDPTLMTSIDAPLAEFLVRRKWITAQLTQTQSGGTSIRRTGNGLTPQGKEFIIETLNR